MTAGDWGPEPPGHSPLPGHLPEPFSAGLVEMRAEWTDFFDTHHDRVVRFMMHVGASRYDAQDAAQEAFTESWELMSRDPGAWRAINGKAAWIRTTALRRLARPPGSRRRPLITADGTIADRPDTGLDHAELTAQTQAVLQALRQLDSESRAVMAFSFDGFTTAETADALNKTQQQVRDVKKKARINLKRQLSTSEGRQP